MPWIDVPITSTSDRVEERDVAIEVPAGMRVVALELATAGGGRSEARLMRADDAHEQFRVAVERERDPALLEVQDGRAILRVFPVAADRPAHVTLELEPIVPDGPYLDAPVARGLDEHVSLYAATPEVRGHGRIARVIIDPVGEPARENTLDWREIRAFVRLHEPQLRRCYDLALARDHALAGTAELRFVIGADGAVASVAVGGSLASPDANACLAHEVASWTFRASDSATVASYPINFELPR